MPRFNQEKKEDLGMLKNMLWEASSPGRPQRQNNNLGIKKLPRDFDDHPTTRYGKIKSKCSNTLNTDHLGLTLFRCTLAYTMRRYKGPITNYNILPWSQARDSFRIVS